VGADVHDQRRGGADRTPGRAGLANLFYWIDRRNGFGGFWATQILPFGDPVSFIGYMDFETAFYSSLRQKQAA
jgi:methyl acetate hydrolase